MADERIYRDDEVEEILDLAMSTHAAAPRPSSPAEGLTLAQLQEVAVEVGVDPAQITSAAHALDLRQSASPRQTSLGMPVSVGSTIALPGPLTDSDWGSVVDEFRDALGSTGRITSHAGKREWTDGRLRAVLEETESGHQIRLTMRKLDAIVTNRLGIVGLLIAMVLLSLIATGTSPVGLELAMLGLLGMGGGILTVNKLTLPKWAHDGEGQIEYVAGRVRELVAERASDSTG